MARFRYRMNVAYWHLADIPMYSANVRFWENSGRRDFGASCPLLTRNGHSTVRLYLARTGAALVHKGQRFWAANVAGFETVKLETSIFDQTLDRAVEMTTAAYTFPSRS
jgi:hypothetical protein